ncbi:MAG: response regulator, partial [Cyanobacteria bacterium J06636_27]
EQGAEIELAACAKEALSKLKTFVPDILISDIGMPEEDGISLLNKIRQLPYNQGGNVTAIALTAFAAEEDRKKSLDAGFQMHLTKPVDTDELIETVINLTNK